MFDIVIDNGMSNNKEYYNHKEDYKTLKSLPYISCWLH